jgi:hypothetical protein
MVDGSVVANRARGLIVGSELLTMTSLSATTKAWLLVVHV